jgi:hypothetical protein
MIWEKKRILVTVKAYPEKSKTHGNIVCTIGITDEGEWIRLYPIPYEAYIFKSIDKYDWIEVECAKAGEKLSRKESYKIKINSLKVIDKSLSSNGSNGKPNWAERNRLILPHISPSIESLSDQFEIDRTSIGIIKPKEIIKFYKDEDLKIYEDTKKAFQQTLFGASIPDVEKVPHIFGYEFKCGGCQEKKHRIQCEDWELLESYRKWGPTYGNTDILWEKLKNKYYDYMLERDLYFYMGMFSRYKTWLIVGLYYPPRNVKKLTNLRATSLIDYTN